MTKVTQKDREADPLLFHGTSLDRAWKIGRERVIKVAPYGVQSVSMTDDIAVALYFAALAADADRSTPVVLTIDAARLDADGYDLEPFSDSVWGEGECAWERETVCWQDIPLEYAVLKPSKPQAIRSLIDQEGV